MAELLSHLVDAPLANILILAGLGFLAVGVIGKISGKIEPGTGGRIMSGILGAALLVYGIHAHYMSDRLASAKAATALGTRTTVPLPPPRVVVAAPPAAVPSPDACAQGYVWREAFANDRVCVPPATRRQVALDNQLAASRRSPKGGPYGADTCRNGFVWREAGLTDHACVPAATRQQTATDNQAAASHRATH